MFNFTEINTLPTIESRNLPKAGLVLDIKPLRLMLHLPVLDMSPYGLVALVGKSQLGETFQSADLEKILHLGTSYKLQLDLPDEMLSEPLVLASLTEKRPSQSGLELTLRFHKPLTAS
jgi:hypothetical protein